METGKPLNSAVNFEMTTIEQNSSDPDSTCKILIKYFTPIDAPQYLKDSIMKHTGLLFASWFNISNKLDIEMSVKNFVNEQVKHVFKLEILPKDVYQNNRIISFTYNWFLDREGVRKNFGKYCFVLNMKDGSRIVPDNLTVSDKQEFLKMAEIEFKKQSGMNPDEKMYELYRFKDNVFQLSDTFAFTASGLVFYYNPDDIAPYSAGLITLLLPRENVEAFMDFYR
jgi:hypothetical protein